MCVIKTEQIMHFRIMDGISIKYLAYMYSAVLAVVYYKSLVSVVSESTISLDSVMVGTEK